jgi:hypothetical protein
MSKWSKGEHNNGISVKSTRNQFKKPTRKTKPENSWKKFKTICIDLVLDFRTQKN